MSRKQYLTLPRFKGLIKQYLEEHPDQNHGLSYDPTLTPLQDIYTKSFPYYVWMTAFHNQGSVWHFMERHMDSLPEGARIIDVGTCSGITGLEFAMALDKNFQVTFHDFEGEGLNFIRWCVQELSIADSTTIIPYGDLVPEEKYDLAIALDVMEHTGNHLGFLSWMEYLGQQIAISYPLTQPFSPPHRTVLDEWVDHEIIDYTIRSRYTVVEGFKQNGRAFFSFMSDREYRGGLRHHSPWHPRS